MDLYGLFCVIWSNLEIGFGIASSTWGWFWISRSSDVCARNACLKECYTILHLTFWCFFARFKFVARGITRNGWIGSPRDASIRDSAPGTIESGMRLWKLKDLKRAERKSSKSSKSRRNVRNVTAHNCKCDARPIANAHVEILHGEDASYLHWSGFAMALQKPEAWLAWNRLGTESLRPEVWSS